MYPAIHSRSCTTFGNTFNKRISASVCVDARTETQRAFGDQRPLSEIEVDLPPTYNVICSWQPRRLTAVSRAVLLASPLSELPRCNCATPPQLWCTANRPWQCKGGLTQFLDPREDSSVLFRCASISWIGYASKWLMRGHKFFGSMAFKPSTYKF